MKKQPEDDFIRILTDRYELFPLDEKGINELDLGCGVGSFTSGLAKLHPERNIYAADVMIGRLRKLVKRNRRMEVENMEILRVEAGNLISYILPDAGLDRVHLLCPDPWPKDKHRSHRLMCSNFISQLHRVLKMGGVFHFASDDEFYFDTVNEVVNASGIFAAALNAIIDIAGIKSDFELRWLEQQKAVRHMAWKTITRPDSIGH